MLPTSRGSCSGSGVLLQMALAGTAPAAILLRGAEDILTLGALVADGLFGKSVPVCILEPADYDALAAQPSASLTHDLLRAGEVSIQVAGLDVDRVVLGEADRAMLAGQFGPACAIAMDVIRRVACLQGAETLTSVTRGHVDGCILAHDANLIFAEKMAEMGAKVRIPTTINAISVDRENWRDQLVPHDFGMRASRLADAYVAMGCAPTFTCAPYTLEDIPQRGEAIGWSESNAVIYANSVLGARTAKHPDFLDLFISLTGRAPLAGVYATENRRPSTIIDVVRPEGADDSFWPLLGWTIGHVCGARVPLIRGLENETATQSDLKSLCAAFGTTSSTPMLHIAGHTPEAAMTPSDGAESMDLPMGALTEAWESLNTGPEDVDLIALGSPHFSFEEAQAFAKALGGRRCDGGVATIMTVGRHTARQLRETGLMDVMREAGVQVVQDLCWCSITEPVFPSTAKVLMTNSAKYAHYAPGLSGREVRFGGLNACADAAVRGHAPPRPDWLA